MGFESVLNPKKEEVKVEEPIVEEEEEIRKKSLKKKSLKKKDLIDPKELYHLLITEILKKKKMQNLTDPQRLRLMLLYLLILKLWKKKPFPLKTKKLPKQKKLITQNNKLPLNLKPKIFPMPTLHIKKKDTYNLPNKKQNPQKLRLTLLIYLLFRVISSKSFS